MRNEKVFAFAKTFYTFAARKLKRYDKEDLSAFEKKTQEQARFQVAYGYGQRTQGVGCTQGQGPQEADRFRRNPGQALSTKP